MTNNPPMADAELDAIQRRVERSKQGAVASFVEGRDHTCGDDLIQTEMTVVRPTAMSVIATIPRGLTPVGTEDLDFTAAARRDIPRLIAEIKRLRTRPQHLTRSQSTTVDGFSRPADVRKS